MEINIDALQDTVQRLLRDFGEEAEEALLEAAKETAKVAKGTLKRTSPKSTVGEKHYADGWKYRVEKNRLGMITVRVYNDKKPGLTHLLEHGHATKNGNGRSYPDTPAHPHIAKVDMQAQYDFIDRMERKLGI